MVDALSMLDSIPDEMEGKRFLAVMVIGICFFIGFFVLLAPAEPDS